MAGGARASFILGKEFEGTFKEESMRAVNNTVSKKRAKVLSRRSLAEQEFGNTTRSLAKQAARVPGT